MRGPIVTEIIPAGEFYPAEEYHQDYLDKNPGGYCHVNLELAKVLVHNRELHVQLRRLKICGVVKFGVDECARAQILAIMFLWFAR